MRFGSETSTWERTSWMPCEAMSLRARVARSWTSSGVRCGLSSEKISMPSKIVPDSFHLGLPAVRAASRWM